MKATRAFPQAGSSFLENGMSLRDWFAGHALSMICEQGSSPRAIATRAYAIADQMMEKSNEGSTNLVSHTTDES